MTKADVDFTVGILNAGSLPAKLSKDPIILHYHSCSFYNFWNKHQAFSVVNKWLGQIPRNPSYDEARELVLSEDMAAGKEYYRGRYHFDDEVANDELVKLGGNVTWT